MTTKIIAACLSAGAFFLMAHAGNASEAADDYSVACRTCHTGSATPNVHHLLWQEQFYDAGMAADEKIQCFDCHQFKTGDQGFYMANDGNTCFLSCHTPILFRGSGKFLARATRDIAVEQGWDISANAKTKMADFHHANYGAPSEDCSRCHTLEWDPELGAQITVPVPGSAGEGIDANNINIVIANDQLVYDIVPGETLEINAAATQGDIASVRWSINNGPITAADDSLFFTYTFKWGEPGDTYVVKLEVFSADGRYAKQNIGVNIR
ncbi:MAG: hypothetical protein KKD73_09825 [Proteobacteria bacterium]|nr:hypothetical protein [Pseudomonadota bacterium]MBU1638891.1 hypothetical protein [Pseudomonadota bacterium]